jgi:threonine/homoserine/homoserine lactone efflux protein
VLPIWAFVGVALPLVLMPGASTAVVLRNSVRGGTRAGIETAIGANAGSVCFGLLCAFGFSIVMQRWPWVWLALRAVGVVYLAWLGFQSVRRGLQPAARRIDLAPTDRATNSGSLVQYLREGFITNTTNPALATFYFVILPQFIPIEVPIVRAALLLTAIHVGLALTWHAVWAAAGGTLARTLADGRPRRILDLVTGIALLALAAKLVL